MEGSRRWEERAEVTDEHRLGELLLKPDRGGRHGAAGLGWRGGAMDGESKEAG